MTPIPTRQQYLQYIKQIAIDVHHLIGDDYNDQVREYLHSLLEHYPERIDSKEVAKHVMKLTGKDISFDDIIDKAEEAIRKQNNGYLPFGALLQLRALRQKYGSKDKDENGGDKS